MNGVHDLGGMHGFGPVQREENEPLFHADWERAVVAMQMSAIASGIYNVDEFRYFRELMDPAAYLSSSYYEIWLDSIARLLVAKGVVTDEELDARTDTIRDNPDFTVTDLPTDARPPLGGGPDTPDEELITWIPGDNVRRHLDQPPRFQPGDPVISGNDQPTGHHRLPRYARAKPGIIHLSHGAFVFPDTNSRGQGEAPQYVYSVRFDGGVLWSASAEPKETVFIDLWESYLSPDESPDTASA